MPLAFSPSTSAALELRRGEPPVIADRDGRAALAGDDGCRSCGRSRSASAGMQRSADDAADVVFAQRWSGRSDARIGASTSSLISYDVYFLRKARTSSARSGALQARTRSAPPGSRPCRRNRSAGLRSAGHGTACRRSSAPSPSVSCTSLPAPRSIMDEMLDHLGHQHVAADDGQVGRRVLRLRLLDQALHLDQPCRRRLPISRMPYRLVCSRGTSITATTLPPVSR